MTTQLELGEAHARTSDPDTSHAAARSVEGEHANSMENRVLHTIRIFANYGITTHELVEATGIPYESVTPRIKPLVQKGLVVDSGERRPGTSKRRCIVWKATT